MGAISATTLLLTQIDKIVLSRMLSLESFGYYSLAAVAANSLYALVTPVAAAVFPGLTREAASGDVSATALLYHRATQTVAVLVLPVAAVLALFAPQVLGIWTRDPKAAAVSGAVLSVLVTGVALNAVMNIPYMLQLAYGRTRLTVVLQRCRPRAARAGADSVHAAFRSNRGGGRMADAQRWVHHGRDGNSASADPAR